MKTVSFVKMEGSGNDFVVVEKKSRFHGLRQTLVRRICDRRFGIGADGVLCLEKSKKADVKMRIFNADGTEAEMCGNGARCVALYYCQKSGSKICDIETKAGLIEAHVSAKGIRLRMMDPADIRLDLCVEVQGERYEVDYVNTGVPHAVIEVEDIEEAPVSKIGRSIRYHKVFAPAGTNVDFIQVLKDATVLIRTYERGVEDETLACGTGSVAGAIIAALNHTGASLSETMKHRVSVKTKSGEILTVYFTVTKKKVLDVWIEGRARLVYKGEYPLV